MINKKYENVQAVVRDFRLVFGTFRHISQVSKLLLILQTIYLFIYFSSFFSSLMIRNVNY